ncbi:MAG: hypothetical protein KDK90_19880 [Leptospiraceae bacterium]|nr:hypothetical protein [Leptospiraceae bacterium]
MKIRKILKNFYRNFISFLAGLETYQSPYSKTIGNPEEIVDPLIHKTALKIAALSSLSSALPYKYGGILPELFAIYSLQGRMIKDIAYLYGKENTLDKEVLIYCLFKHNNLKIIHKIVEDMGERLIVRALDLTIIEKILNKQGILISKKIIRNSMARIFPVLAIGIVGSLAYKSTKKVGKTAKDIFSREIILENEIKNSQTRSIGLEQDGSAI